MNLPPFISLMTEDHKELPSSCKRTVLEFVMRDEYERGKYEHLFRLIDMPVTSSVCNGKFHGMRSLTSFWEDEKERVLSSIEGVSSSLLEPFFDARVCPHTPDTTKAPFRVLKYMGEGHKHHSCEELEIHCPMTVMFEQDVKTKWEICESLQRVPNSFRLENKSGVFIVTATLRGWKKYLNDQTMINEATARTPTQAFEEVCKLFYRYYPTPSRPVYLSADREHEDTWRK